MIIKAISSIFEGNGLFSRVPHLQGEKIFGSCKKEVNLPFGSNMDHNNTLWVFD
jgi:hypothetical protein